MTKRILFRTLPKLTYFRPLTLIGNEGKYRCTLDVAWSYFSILKSFIFLTTASEITALGTGRFSIKYLREGLYCSCKRILSTLWREMKYIRHSIRKKFSFDIVTYIGSTRRRGRMDIGESELSVQNLETRARGDKIGV